LHVWIRALTRVAALLVVLTGSAHAESQVFDYQLFSGEKLVGKREAKILYLPAEQGEVRLLQAYTQLSVPVGALSYKYVQRLGGRLGGTRSFASSIEDNSLVREVQGYFSEEGQWVVTVVEKGHARTWNLPAEAIDLTSAEILDPERAERTIGSLTSLRVLATETGDVVTGAVTDLGLQDIPLGGKTVHVHRYRWSPPAGDMVLSYDDSGYLVQYEAIVAGKRLSGRLVQFPEGRTFGGALNGPITNGQVAEEPL